jgi:hypothetical protein
METFEQEFDLYERKEKEFLIITQTGVVMDLD